MPGSTKALFIGIDSADKDLINQWADEGLLPNLARLRDKSAWNITRNPPGLYVGALWPSFYTGLSPASHGRYCFTQLQPGTYDNVSVRPSDVKGVPFWKILSQAGKRVAVIDIPKSPPPEAINGVHIVDWGTHDPDYAMRTYPPELGCDIETRFGRDAIGNCNAFRTCAEEFQALTTALEDRVRRKAAITEYILAQGNWDCVLTVFSESHCVGHQCWHLHDPSHVRHDNSVAAVVGDPIKSVYREIDKAVGRILDQVDLASSRVMVLASHGIQAHYDCTFLLDPMLRRLERVERFPAYPSFVGALRHIWRQLPQRIQPRVASIPYGKRKAFQVPNNDVYGAIRINLVGREPEGRIRAGREYEQFCDQLSSDLMDFVNVDTGQAIVKRILRIRELYGDGEDLGALPDLLVEWDRSAPVSKVRSSKAGSIEGQYRKCRTGDHRESGMVFITDPSIPVGSLTSEVSVTDLAPTISAWLGVELPRCEGQPISL